MSNRVIRDRPGTSDSHVSGSTDGNPHSELGQRKGLVRSEEARCHLRRCHGYRCVHQQISHGELGDLLETPGWASPPTSDLVTELAVRGGVSMGDYRNVQKRSQNSPSPSTFNSTLPRRNICMECHVIFHNGARGTRGVKLHGLTTAGILLASIPRSNLLVTHNALRYHVP